MSLKFLFHFYRSVISWYRLRSQYSKTMLTSLPLPLACHGELLTLSPLEWISSLILTRNGELFSTLSAWTSGIFSAASGVAYGPFSLLMATSSCDRVFTALTTIPYAPSPSFFTTWYLSITIIKLISIHF